MIDVPPGDSFSVAALRVTLDRGSLYQHPLGGDSAQQPLVASVWPAIAYDTAVSGPYDLPVTLLMPGAAHTQPMTDAYVDVDWSLGPGIRTGAGTFRIARVTTTNDAQGTVESIVYGYAGVPYPQPSQFVELIPPGLVAPGSISGHARPASEVFADLNGDGVHNEGEPRSIASSRNTSLTNSYSDQVYRLVVPPGTYDIRPVLSAGETAQPPLRTVTVGSGVHVNGQPFQTQFSGEGWVGGWVWNRSPILFPNGTGLSDVVVYADLNGDGARNHGEPSTLTRTYGRFLLKAVPPGPVAVRIEVPPGWHPAPGEPPVVHLNSVSGVESHAAFGVTQVNALRNPSPFLSLARGSTAVRSEASPNARHQVLDFGCDVLER